MGLGLTEEGAVQLGMTETEVTVIPGDGARLRYNLSRMHRS